MMLFFLEVSCFTVLKIFKKQKRHFMSKTDDFIHFLDQTIDEGIKLNKIKSLGWEHNKNSSIKSINLAGNTWIANTDDFGARKGTDFDSNLVSVYGNSFAFCDEVNDDETWPFFLSNMLEKNVLNFGVGGYGTDQALLRFEKNIVDGIITPITVLTIFEDNIFRCFNMFRPFLAGPMDKAFFKPRFINYNDSLKVIKNPLFHLKDENSSAEIIKILEKYDDWYSIHDEKIKIRFPFFINVFKIFKNKIIQLLKSKHTPSYFYWHDDLKTRLMDKIINRFYKLSKLHNTIPIIIFIPRLKKVEPPQYLNYYKELKERYIGRMDILNIFVPDDQKKDFNILPFKGHASTVGNKIISNTIYNHIIDSGYTLNFDATAL